MLMCDQGPIFKINVLGHQIVFVGSVALLEEICDETRFRKLVTGPVVEMRYSVNDSLFVAYDHEKSWGVAHRLIYPYVSREAVDTAVSFRDMSEIIGDLTGKWSSSPKQSVRATDDLGVTLLSSCVKCFFNQRLHVLDESNPNDERKKAREMVQAFEGATTEAMRRPTRPWFLNWLYQGRFDDQTKYMRGYAAEIVKSRKENTTTQSRNDMLDAMLNGTDSETGEKLKDSQVIDEVITILIGAATAANLISYALYFLIENSTAHKKACEEIDAIVGNGPIDLAHLKELHYVEACLRESIRLSATAPGFNIEPIPSKTDDKSPVLLAGGQYQVPHNQGIIPILNAVNRDPAVFEFPEEFRPEQVLGDKWDNLPAGAKKGFGNGKRECIGKAWAWQWSFLTLASIIKEVSFEFADPNYKLHVNGAFSIKPLNFDLLMSPRQK